LTYYAVDKLISEARRLAAAYRRTTGKSLGISTEIAKHDACRLLQLEAVEEAGGYDAIDPQVQNAEQQAQRIQIKGRTIFEDGKSGQRVGQLKLEQPWDTVVLVLMDDDFETFEIHAVQRQQITEALQEKEHKPRSRRGAMSVAQFKRIGQLIWTRQDGRVQDDALKDNRTG